MPCECDREDNHNFVAHDYRYQIIKIDLRIQRETTENIFLFHLFCSKGTCLWEENSKQHYHPSNSCP